MEDNKYTREMLSYLPREELRHLLIGELNNGSSKADDSLVRLLLAELQSRGDDPKFTSDESVEAACEKFQMATEQTQTPRKRRQQSWMVVAASVILVLGILFFTLPSTAQAGNIQGMLTWWSDSVFQFFTPGKQPLTQEYVYITDHPGLQQIYDAVTEMGITEPIVPRWVPDEFELYSLESFPLPLDRSLLACLTANGKTIMLSAVVQNKDSLFQHEKDQENVTIWDLGGCEHYVLSNKENLTIAWVTNGIECTIITDCPEEDVYKMIKSIYTSEG